MYRVQVDKALSDKVWVPFLWSNWPPATDANLRGPWESACWPRLPVNLQWTCPLGQSAPQQGYFTFLKLPLCVSTLWKLSSCLHFPLFNFFFISVSPVSFCGCCVDLSGAEGRKPLPVILLSHTWNPIVPTSFLCVFCPCAGFLSLLEILRLGHPIRWPRGQQMGRYWAVDGTVSALLHVSLPPRVFISDYQEAIAWCRSAFRIARNSH